MKRAFLLLLATFILTAVALTVYGYSYFRSPGPLVQPANVILPKGQGLRAIAGQLEQAGVIAHADLFSALAMTKGSGRRFKAGEYAFTPRVSPEEVMTLLAEGKVVIHKITVPEGWTSRQVKQLLEGEPALAGPVGVLEEGGLLPQTYYFTYGDNREEVAQRMRTAMRKAVDGLWKQRRPGLPFATQAQAVTLASIVEKETGVADERARVAAVFVNRLRTGMKLQSDPTVAYGLEQRSGLPLARPLTTADLREPTPYNTYVIDGLPPGPIANPGRTALEAAFAPADGEELYFVATGSGGHYFARTLDEHNANVRRYRETQRH